MHPADIWQSLLRARVWAQRVFGLILSVLVTLIWGVGREGGAPWLVRET